MNYGIGLYINKRRIRLIAAVSAAVIAALCLFVGHTIYSVRNYVTQSCFDELEIAAKQLADELYTSVGSDHTTLSAIAAIIAGQREITDDDLFKIISSYDFNATYISYLAVLKPDGWMLFSDGTSRDVSAAFDFGDEARAGEHISGIHQSEYDPEMKVVHYAVPVVKEGGEAAYILFGVVRLSDLAREFTTDLYDGHAYAYIEDGDTGDFILDSWHKTQGNIIAMGGRRTLPGYSLEKAIDDMGSGISGEIAFVSNTTGNTLYMRYEPLGVNNWNAIITVEETYALAKSKAISSSLYQMAIICGGILLAYFSFIVINLFGAYKQVRKLGTEDQNTGLLNRNAFDKYVSDSCDRLFPSVSCVFADANDLHALNNEHGHAEGDRMLKVVADALLREFDHGSVFRIGGDEFAALSEKDDAAACEDKMRRVTAAVEKEGYSIAFGIVCYQNETGLSRVIRDADEKMLTNKKEYYETHDRRRK